MILVDSSVWIDFFRGVATPQSEMLDALPGVECLAISDLVLAEVSPVFIRDREFNQTRKLLTLLTMIDIEGKEIAIQAARNNRALPVLARSEKN